MFTVWMKDAIDQDRWVLGNLDYAKANQLVNSLQAILPGVPVWMEEE